MLYLYHPFPRSPDIINAVFRCTALDNGYAPGEEVVVTCNPGVNLVASICAAGGPGLVRTHDFSTNSVYLPLKTSGAAFSAVFARWSVKLRGIWLAPV